MATRTFATLKSLISSKLGNVSGNLTQGAFLDGMNLALDDLRLRLDFPETERTAQLVPALFNDVTDYAVPSDMYGDDLINLFPFVDLPSTPRGLEMDRNSSVEFQRNLLDGRAGIKYTIEYNNGRRTLRVLGRLNSSAQSIRLANCDTFDQNGTWTADLVNSDTNSVATNQVTYFEGNGSVQFNVTAAQSAFNRSRIFNNNFTSTPFDTSGMSNPYAFFYANIPDITNVTNVQLIVGSDAGATPSTKANYYTFTATAGFDGSTLQSGKNLLGVARSSAVQTGVVDTASIQYLEFVINYTVAQTDMVGILLDGIYFRDGELYSAKYRSSNIVQAADLTKKAYFTLDDDTLLLNAEGEALYVQYAAGYLSPNVKDLATGQFLSALADQKVEEYKFRHPSSRRFMKKSWYYSGNDMNEAGNYNQSRRR